MTLDQMNTAIKEIKKQYPFEDSKTVVEIFPEPTNRHNKEIILRTVSETGEYITVTKTVVGEEDGF